MAAASFLVYRPRLTFSVSRPLGFPGQYSLWSVLFLSSLGQGVVFTLVVLISCSGSLFCGVLVDYFSLVRQVRPLPSASRAGVGGVGGVGGGGGGVGWGGGDGGVGGWGWAGGWGWGWGWGVWGGGGGWGWNPTYCLNSRRLTHRVRYKMAAVSLMTHRLFFA